MDGRVRCVEFWREDGATRVVVDAPRRGLVLLSGSFNPVHQVTTAMRSGAERMRDCDGVRHLGWVSTRALSCPCDVHRCKAGTRLDRPAICDI